jgi:predicted kinase
LKKQIIILVGPKGSGKTFIGTLIQKETGIHFLRVEDIWLSLKSERLSNDYIIEGFNLVRQNIDQLLTSNNIIIIESTGTSEHFFNFLDNLRSLYEVKLVKIVASPDVCVNRIRFRNSSLHVPVSDDMLSLINQAALKTDLMYDLIIDNEKSSDEMIIETFQTLLG